MKHVILTDYEAGQIDTYLELTSGRINRIVNEIVC